eukprot:1394012-Pyramimonas_sp.AAC.1
MLCNMYNFKVSDSHMCGHTFRLPQFAAQKIVRVMGSAWWTALLGNPCTHDEGIHVGAAVNLLESEQRPRSL